MIEVFSVHYYENLNVIYLQLKKAGRIETFICYDPDITEILFSPGQIISESLYNQILLSTKGC